jgi:hypothetical protein
LFSPFWCLLCDGFLFCRCELYICAGDGHVREKLASANAKALVAHLRAAELQFARGESVIRLEPRLRSRHKCTWFTRATLERYPMLPSLISDFRIHMMALIDAILRFPCAYKQCLGGLWPALRPSSAVPFT